MSNACDVVRRIARWLLAVPSLPDVDVILYHVVLEFFFVFPLLSFSSFYSFVDQKQVVLLYVAHVPVPCMIHDSVSRNDDNRSCFISTVHSLSYFNQSISSLFPLTRDSL